MNYPKYLPFVAPFLCALSALGADQSWNTNGATDIWNTVDQNWDVAAVWTNDNVALFPGTGEPITVDAVSASGLSFTGDGYSLSGGTLTLSGTGPVVLVDSGLSASIASVVAGAGGLAKNGDGVARNSTVSILHGNGAASGPAETPRAIRPTSSASM